MRIPLSIVSHQFSITISLILVPLSSNPYLHFSVKKILLCLVQCSQFQFRACNSLQKIKVSSPLFNLFLSKLKTLFIFECGIFSLESLSHFFCFTVSFFFSHTLLAKCLTFQSTCLWLSFLSKGFTFTFYFPGSFKW